MACGLASLLVLGGVACSPSGEQGSQGNTTGGIATGMKPIQYSQSEYEKGTATDNIILSVPGRAVQTGDTVEATVSISSSVRYDAGAESVYYIVDWGDGTWSYQGPGLQSATKQSSISLPHTYKKAGAYDVTATAVAMQQGDAQLGWSKAKTIRVEGADYEPDTMIQNVKVISSGSKDAEHKAENVTDGESTYFQSEASKDIDDELYVGYIFNEIYTLDKFEVKIPAEATIFPSNIAVEYTSDFGKTWQSLPKYYYLYDYSVGRFNPIMQFPNPKGGTLVFNMDGIVANGVRFVQKLTTINLSQLKEEKFLFVEEMRVYGSLRTLLYTSKGQTFDADLNNMWTIFGTAKTEPVVYGSIMGESQNASPFRTGSAMIGSTEWMEWIGLKFNFTDYAKVNDTYLDLLVRIRTGNDTWSDDDGYVWATPDSPIHLNETFGCHYSLNPIYILAVRNYLLQCNRQGQFNEDGTVFTEFMDLTNSLGQSIQYKIDKAMSYMMNTLRGKTGIMTILDPAKDGTTSGMSSNYWDVHKAFGYMSAYENVYFYASLLAYADIYDFEADALEKAGDTASAQQKRAVAEEYRGYAATTKEMYNTLFWDSEKGRYIGGINVNGVRIDLGYTFVNYMAAAYGLADEERAQQIYSWVDGTRIIEGDTSTGEDIYGKFKYASRSTTVDASTVTDENGEYYWYDHEGALPCTPNTFGGFGNQMQNGGTIFYISYYDLMGRIRMLGADNAFDRFSVIMDEFHIDSLRRNSYSAFGEYVEGVLGEFPESGLVPYTFICGFLGINPMVEGLQIKPNLPSDMEYAGISEYWYGNREYSIQISRAVSAPVVEIHAGVYYLTLPANSTYYITADNRLIEG